METHFVENDGGRKEAGYIGKAGDCVTRAIAIATGKPYQEVYDALFCIAENHSASKRDRTARSIAKRGASPRNGVARKVYDAYMKSLGWKWTATMHVGSGCTVHLKKEELPRGRIVARVSKHLVAVVDGVIHDTFDCSRDGLRCVYGYYSKP